MFLFILNGGYFVINFWPCYLLISGWGGGGLGSAEQGMTDPVAHAEVRDRTDMYKGIGISLSDPFEQFRKSKSAGFIQRMKAREDSMKQ